ncbi:MAG: M20/M25/M40 family metallo-hydrolase [Deltaproteobacteria bacterium]|jgi:acetylornithine deacetylase/succinyl-diaminopimelate desuccinylase-like protein|nr:M20/M25/M40 family metallo-hydrolase [Deltaproteobacteria bacterium]
MAEEDPKPLAREIYADLVAFPSTQSHGGSAEIAKYAANRLLEAGFDPRDVEILGPRPEAAGVLARFRGRGEREPVLVFAHLDVVEALPEDWSMPPFELIEKDGYFYGRGTSDNKAGAAALLANFIRLKREGFEPARDFILMFTGDEETEMESVAYFAQRKRESIDAEFALNTDGGTIETAGGKPLAFVVQAAEKVYATLRLEVRNPGGHSSRPRADNAIYDLAEGLVRLRSHQFPVSLNDVTRSYFSQAAQFHEPEMAAAMRALAEDRASESDIARLDSSIQLRTVMRTTCVPTQLEGGHAENALPQLAAAIVNCRVLPQDPPEQIVAEVRRVLASDDIQVTMDYEPVSSPPSPLTPNVMDAVERVAGEMYPGIPVIADMTAGATDGLYLRNAGIPTYGVSALREDTEDIRAHGRDERVEVGAFYDSVEYWYRLLRAL